MNTEHRRRYMKQYRSDHAEELRDSYREWYRNWYPKNRDRLSQKNRAVYAARAARRKPISREDLELCHKNPQLASSIAGTSRVVCLVCGRRYEELQNHLRVIHSMNVRDYRSRYGASAPILSVARARALQRAGQEGGRREKPRARVDWFEIDKGAIRGDSQSDIAEKLSVSRTTISRISRTLELGGPNCLWEFGQPVDSDSLAWLKQQASLPVRDGGLVVSELVRICGIKQNALEAVLHPDRPHQRLKVKTGQAVNVPRDRILAGSSKIIFRKRPDLWPCSPPALLLSLIPEIRKHYQFLRGVLKGTRKFLRNDLSAGVRDLLEYIRSQATPENNFLRFLRWAPDLELLLEKDLNRLRGTDRLERIACEWIGSRWKIEGTAVREAVKPRIRRVAAKHIAILIRELFPSDQGEVPAVKLRQESQVLTEARPLKRAGGRPKLRLEKKRDYMIGQKVESALPRFEEMFSFTRGISKGIGRDRNRFRAKLKSEGYTQTEIDAAIESDRPLVAARWFVSLEMHLSYDSVSQYHLAYRRMARKPE